MRRLAALLAAIWLGMHLGFGYIAAPILFRQFGLTSEGRMLAGDLAGELFHWVNNWGLVTWFILFWIVRRDFRQNYRRNYLPFWVGTLWIFLMVNEWLLTPVIEVLKTGQENWLHNLIGGRFGLWHGIASIVYLLAALIGLGLCIRLLRLDKRSIY